MSGGHQHQLSMDREFRYILQWFAEWSEIQREDFVPVLLESLVCGEVGGEALLLNGVLAPGLAGASLVDKPMSLFQCRVKLYREWSAKWPADLKQKLRDKCQLIDAEWSDRFACELLAGDEPAPAATNGFAEVANGDDSAEEVADEQQQHDFDADEHQERDVAVVAAVIVEELAANDSLAAAQLSPAMNLQNGPVSA